MRAAWLAGVVVAAGCASGHAFEQNDAPGNDIDAAPPKVDAPTNPIDAPKGSDAAIVIDAAIDAMIPIDAPKAIDAAPPPDACVPQLTQLLANPALDLSPVGTSWTQVPVPNTACEDPDFGFPEPCGPFAVITGDDGIPEDSAPFKVWLGGISGDDDGNGGVFVDPATNSATDSAFQDVVIPAGTTKLTLAGKSVVITSESTTATTAFDTANVALVQTDGTPIDGHILDVSNVTGNSGSQAWVPFSHDIDPTNLSGTTVRLRLTSTNDITNATSFFFDTFSLTATHCP